MKETTVGPEYCCDICLQWCYKSNALKLKRSKYDQKILYRCYKENHGYISKNLMYYPERFQRCYDEQEELDMQNLRQNFFKNKMLPRSQANNSLGLDPVLDVFLRWQGAGSN